MNDIASDPGNITMRHQIEHPSPRFATDSVVFNVYILLYFSSNLNYLSNKSIIQSSNNRGITLVNRHKEMEEVEVCCYD